MILIHEIILLVKLRIVKKDESVLDPSTMLAPVNNIMNSLFKSTKVELNGKLVNDNCETTYSSYLTTLLSFDRSAKTGFLQSSGWFEDIDGQFDPPATITNDSDGFAERRELFRNKDNDAYSDKYITLCGTLHHDLASSDTGIPNGVGISIKLDYSDDKFRLMCINDNIDAMVEISEVELHVPVAEVNEKLHAKMMSRLDHESMKIFYTRTQVIEDQITAGTLHYRTNTIFKANDILPCRIYFFFLQNEQLTPTDFKSNPYKFCRKWKKKDDTYCWVKRLNLLINGQSIDSIQTDATETDDMVSFLRFNLYTGLQNSPKGCGITYEAFMRHCAFFVFDLSSSGKCGSDYWIPAILTGNTKLEVSFSSETPCELTLMSFLELPSLTTIDHERNVLHSYFTGSIS